MKLYEIMLKYIKEKSDNEFKRFQVAALEQTLEEEKASTKSNVADWSKKRASLIVGLHPEHKWEKIMYRIGFGEYQNEAMDDTVNFGKKIMKIAKDTDVDLENPEKTKLDLSFLSKNRDGEINK